MLNRLEEVYANGEISEAVYRGYKSGAGSRAPQGTSRKNAQIDSRISEELRKEPLSQSSINPSTPGPAGRTSKAADDLAALTTKAPTKPNLTIKSSLTMSIEIGTLPLSQCILNTMIGMKRS